MHRLAPGAMILVDTHAHLDLEQFKDDLPETIERARNAGVRAIVNAGGSLASSVAGLALAKRYPSVYAAVGASPHDASEWNADACAQMEELAASPRVVAVGETGLDYAKKYAPVDVQREAFRGQLELAGRLGLPVIIHNREADEDTLSMLAESAAHEPLRGVMHCFSGSAETARRAIDLGLFIAVGGVITFPNAGGLREVVKGLPVEWLVIETDAPYLAPKPMRGNRNEPAYITEVANALAQLLGMDAQELARTTSRNAAELFGIDIETPRRIE